MSIVVTSFRKQSYAVIAVAVCLLSWLAASASAAELTVEDLRGSWSGTLETDLAGRHVTGPVRCEFVDDGRLTIWMPDRETGNFEIVGQQIWARFGPGREDFIVADEVERRGDQLMARLHLHSDPQGVVNRVVLRRTEAAYGSPEVAGDEQDELARLFAGHEITLPIRSAEEMTWHERAYVAAALAKVSRATSTLRAAGRLTDAGFLVEVSDDPRHQDSMPDTQLVRELQERLQSAFADPAAVHVVLNRKPLDGHVTSLFAIEELRLRSDLTKGSNVNLFQVWRNVVNSIEAVPGVQLRGETEHIDGKTNRIWSNWNLVTVTLPGRVVIERIAVGMTPIVERHEDDMRVELGVRIDIESEIRWRRASSRRWMRHTILRAAELNRSEPSTKAAQGCKHRDLEDQCLHAVRQRLGVKKDAM